MVLAFFAAAGVVGFGILALVASVVAWIPIVVLIAGVLLLILIGGLVARKPLTALGAATRDHLPGPAESIEWAEAHRLRLFQSPCGPEREPPHVQHHPPTLPPLTTPPP